MSLEATKKAVLVARARGAVGPSPQGVLQAFAHATSRMTATGDARLAAIAWGLKYQPPRDRRGAFKAASILLRHAVFPRRGGPAPKTLAAICEAALTEWMNDQCPRCHGRGRTGTGREVVHERRLTCSTCRGERRLFRTASDSATRIEAPCGACAGRGWNPATKTVHTRLRACSQCRSGRRIWRTKERALALHMTGQEFGNWSQSYHAALRHLRALDAETCGRVDFRLGRAENPDTTDGAKPSLPANAADEEDYKGALDSLGAIPSRDGEGATCEK